MRRLSSQLGCCQTLHVLAHALSMRVDVAIIVKKTIQLSSQRDRGKDNITFVIFGLYVFNLHQLCLHASTHPRTLTPLLSPSLSLVHTNIRMYGFGTSFVVFSTIYAFQWLKQKCTSYLHFCRSTKCASVHIAVLYLLFTHTQPLISNFSDAQHSMEQQRFDFLRSTHSQTD